MHGGTFSDNYFPEFAGFVTFATKIVGGRGITISIDVFRYHSGGILALLFIFIAK